MVTSPPSVGPSRSRNASISLTTWRTSRWSSRGGGPSRAAGLPRRVMRTFFPLATWSSSSERCVRASQKPMVVTGIFLLTCLLDQSSRPQGPCNHPRKAKPTMLAYCSIRHQAAAELRVPLLNLLQGVVHFVLGKLGKHRQRQTLGSVPLALRNTGLQLGGHAPRISFLLVDGDRVVHFDVNAGLAQEPFKVVPLGMLDHVEVIHVPIPRGLVRKLETGGLQSLGVTLGQGAPPVSPLSDVLQLHAENSGVKIVQPAVEPEAVNRTL